VQKIGSVSKVEMETPTPLIYKTLFPSISTFETPPCSEQGNRWVERVLSLHHTCRIRGHPTFPLVVEAVSCLFNGETPDLTWITHDESLPACSTP
jgi:hypothetical protein